MAESYFQRTKAPLQNPFVFALFLLAVLPLFHFETLNWQEYLRLGMIAIGLNLYAWWRCGTLSTDSECVYTAILIALGFIFAVTQFDSRMSAVSWHTVGGASILSIIAFVLFLFRHRYWRPLSILDWVVVGVIILTLVLSIGSHILFKKSFPLYLSYKLVIYLLIWFMVTQWVPSDLATGRRLTQTIAVVFGLVCLVGVSRIGQAYYYHSVGERMRYAGEHEDAIVYFDSTFELSSFLKLESLQDAAIFAKAEILYSQGDTKAAAQTLSLQDGFVLLIPANSWEGPSQGVLYTNISCWKNLMLYEGLVQVQISARGLPALGIWPQMRVRLGDEVLGEVEVDTLEEKVYVFEARVKRGRQQLEVSFVNDYFSPPENRDLWVAQAEIRYLEMAWR